MINITETNKNATEDLFSKLNALINKELIGKLNKFLLALDDYLGKDKEPKKVLKTPTDEEFIALLLVFLITYIVLKNN